jgi:TetR/AcrR family transcriptional regulator, ethionamide resistance regulator
MRSAALIERERAAGRASGDGPPARSLARALMHMTERSIYDLLARRADVREAEELVEVLTMIWNRTVGTSL